MLIIGTEMLTSILTTIVKQTPKRHVLEFNYIANLRVFENFDKLKFNIRCIYLK